MHSRGDLAAPLRTVDHLRLSGFAVWAAINTDENGVFVPSTVLALRLAKALKQPVEALFWISA